ncbi:hypothetical protein [Streptomyces sp. NPDC101165]|uniref:hypothetical protein n=1 Tax=Streptomyces sp. NPDC101165 TaxID=3366119 RepID=UPI00382047D5
MRRGCRLGPGALVGGRRGGQPVELGRAAVFRLGAARRWAGWRARFQLDIEAWAAVAGGELRLLEAVRAGRVTVTGEGTLAKVLREA